MREERKQKAVKKLSIIVARLIDDSRPMKSQELRQLRLSFLKYLYIFSLYSKFNFENVRKFVLFIYIAYIFMFLQAF